MSAPELPEKPTVQQLYAEWSQDSAVDSLLDQLPSPRAATMLVDTIHALGLGEGHRLLDIGCRNGAYAAELVKRTGCTAVGVDISAENVRAAPALLEGEGVAGSVAICQGAIEALPCKAGTFDYIWCRDMLNHALGLGGALAECHRVLKRPGWLVVYQTFATERLEPKEAEALFRPMAIQPENEDAERFERLVAATGFKIIEREVVGSEWREAWEADGDGRSSKALLRAARLVRGEERLVEKLGHARYRLALADALWGVYQMIGKLEPRVYVLRAG